MTGVSMRILAQHPRRHGKMSLVPKQDRECFPLRVWVAVGTLVTTAVGMAVLLVFARLQAGKWIWTDGLFLNGTQWFDASRTTLTLIGIIGLGGAAFIAYRKQRSTEATHVLEETGALRSRYTLCAEQLGNDAPAVRLAGVYALGSLTDDWCRFRDWGEQMVCIDLLCAYLRMPRSSPSSTLESTQCSTAAVDSHEIEVRTAICGVILEHTHLRAATALRWWHHHLNLRGANLESANWPSVVMKGAVLTRANLTEGNLAHADLTGIEMAGVNLTNAFLVRANLTQAYMAGESSRV